MPTYQQHPSSFRDPSGFVFQSAGKLYRQINTSYQSDYELLMGSGLYQQLVDQRMLIPHEEIADSLVGQPGKFKTILPEFIPFISYPYEWCFEELQDAALVTLNIMKASIDHGMILKDATPYNIQFISGTPVHIDTLSFEKYNESKPWIAYRQFCETFLYPLVVSKYSLMEAHRLFHAYPEGMPAKSAAAMLPTKARFNLGNWLHIFLPASVAPGEKNEKVSFNRNKLTRIIDHLHQIIGSLEPPSNKNSVWKNYYDKDILSEQYLSNKESIVGKMINVEGKNVLDLGSNQGVFSKLLASRQNNVVAVDNDTFSISVLYRQVKKEALNILPLCIDVSNPPGSGGFMNGERKSFTERKKFDLCIALALVHHLCIGKNIPLSNLADLFTKMCSELIIEFVPKEDEKVQQLLKSREDIFEAYNQQAFETAFSQQFSIQEKQEVPGSRRVIYKMKLTG